MLKVSFLCDNYGKFYVMGHSVCCILFLFGFIGINVMQNFTKVLNCQSLDGHNSQIVMFWM
jgi:hypothetical protein